MQVLFPLAANSLKMCIPVCQALRAIFRSISQSSPLKVKSYLVALPLDNTCFHYCLLILAWLDFVKRNRFCRQGYIRKKKEALSIAQATVICIARVFNFMLLHSHLQYNLQRHFITIIFSHYIQWNLLRA